MTGFENVFNENKDFIYKYLLKLSHNPDVAEELTQETFFRAYINYSSLKDHNKVSVWLCQIAKNAYYSWYNEQKRFISSEENTIAETDETDSPENLFVQKEISKQALTCLHELEEPYKEVFMLNVFGEVSMNEISALFGKSESWARVTFYRAKQKLKERMRQKYGL